MVCWLQNWGILLADVCRAKSSLNVGSNLAATLEFFGLAHTLTLPDCKSGQLVDWQLRGNLCWFAKLFAANSDWPVCRVWLNLHQDFQSGLKSVKGHNLGWFAQFF